MEIPTMARQVARVVRAHHQQQTGQSPSSVTVVLCEGSLVITLHGTLTAAEQAMVRIPDGVVRLEEVQRQLFASSWDVLREEVKRIMGVEIHEETAEVQASTGTVIHTLETTNIDHVILHEHEVSWDSWSGS